MGTKVIWLPTVDAENGCRKHGKSGGIRMTNDHGVPTAELRRIFMLIKEYDVVLATGHIAPEEIRYVVDSARNIGVQKIMITHPEYWVVDMSLESQKKIHAEVSAVYGRSQCQPGRITNYDKNHASTALGAYGCTGIEERRIFAIQRANSFLRISGAEHTAGRYHLQCRMLC